MPYVKRDGEGNIIDTSPVETAEHQEFLSQESEEVFQFNKSATEASSGQSLNYRDNRRYAYPSVGDQFDTIAKTLKYLWDNGADIGPDGEALVNQLIAVKDRFPKE